MVSLTHSWYTKYITNIVYIKEDNNPDQCKMQTAACRLWSGGKMRTEGKMQTADQGKMKTAD